ncbi:hypothetical protein C8J55DRAFT_227833 [Lentinula edodes]|uniref:Uncharacterized protein n=1 Tax=Lentinula lateritia TaxID=40482 RepID=A0A9W8ZV58_9AGAR|nr:hypothetical protein C8J55DRAFT_227833 [Lentinula edodes]
MRRLEEALSDLSPTAINIWYLKAAYLSVTCLVTSNKSPPKKTPSTLVRFDSSVYLSLACVLANPRIVIRLFCWPKVYIFRALVIVTVFTNISAHLYSNVYRSFTPVGSAASSLSPLASVVLAMLTRIFPSSPSPSAFYSFYLLFFATAFFNIAFVNSTPVSLLPTGFERCRSHPITGTKLRVAFYDQGTQTTSKSHCGILILCIGQINCFGYTSAGTVIRPKIQYRSVSDTERVHPDTYHTLQIKPNCDKFNVWSYESQPKLTLVEFLTSIVNLQNAISGTEIDSEISYILAVLDYLHTNQMLVQYEKEGIKLALDQIKSTQLDAPKLSKIPGSSRLSWGFYSWPENAWATASKSGLPEKVVSLSLCFGVQHCFGLDPDGKVQDKAPKKILNRNFADTRYHLAWDNPKEHPSFNLKKFEEFETSPFFTRMFSTRFADIEPAEIKKETGLEKGVDEDGNTFFFRALLKYMASKEIITNYNEQTCDQEIKDLEVRVIRTKGSKAPALLDNSNTPRVGSGSTHAGAPEGSGNNFSVGGSTRRVTGSSSQRTNATFDPSISNLLN